LQAIALLFDRFGCLWSTSTNFFELFAGHDVDELFFSVSTSCIALLFLLTRELQSRSFECWRRELNRLKNDFKTRDWKISLQIGPGLHTGLNIVGC
jgi:hypothetical protein